MIPLKIDDRKVTLATSWAEVNYEKFIDLSLCGNDMVKSVAVLSGIPEEELSSATFSEGLDILFQQTKFLSQYPAITEIPTRIGKYELGENIPTLGQLNAITAVAERSVQSKNLRVQLEALADIAAIYCTTPFDKEKAGYLGKEFMTYPCEEVLSAGNYYLSKALSTVSRRPLADMRKGVKFVRPSFFKRLKDKWHSLL